MAKSSPSTSSSPLPARSPSSTGDANTEVTREVAREPSPAGETHLLVGSERFRAESAIRARCAAAAPIPPSAGPARICAPMPGKVIRLLASEGDEVEAGQGLLVVQAMKMQNEFQSTKPGRLTKIAVHEASAVNSGGPARHRRIAAQPERRQLPRTRLPSVSARLRWKQTARASKAPGRSRGPAVRTSYCPLFLNLVGQIVSIFAWSCNVSR